MKYRIKLQVKRFLRSPLVYYMGVTADSKEEAKKCVRRAKIVSITEVY